MKSIRRLSRLLRLLIHVLNGMFLTLLFAGLLRMSFDRPFYQRIVRWWLHKIVRIVGVQATVMGQPATAHTLLVANHVSWLDIPLLGGVAGPRFLSKQEVRHWPVIGWLADRAGTLFIARGKAGAAAQASQVIVQAMQAGRSVLVFPEGTTTTGNDVRTFHARLFAPAVDNDLAVQPVCLDYGSPSARGLTNPLVPYVNEQSLLDNLWGLLGEKSVPVQIHFLPPLATAGVARKAIAADCEEQIRQVLKQREIN